MRTILKATVFIILHPKTLSRQTYCKHLFLAIILALLCSPTFAQLGTKFEKVNNVPHIDRPQISERQAAINNDVTMSFKLQGFTLPLSANKYQFEHNWNNNPIDFIKAGGIIIDKHGETYSVNSNGDLINHQGDRVDFSGIIIDDYYSIRKFFYWIELSPSYVIWLSIIIICLYSIILLILKRVNTKYRTNSTILENKKDENI